MDKQKYLEALKSTNGKIDEYSLGESLGLSEERTKQIIKELEQEGKIEFQSIGLCSYRPKK